MGKKCNFAHGDKELRNLDDVKYFYITPFKLICKANVD